MGSRVMTSGTSLTLGAWNIISPDTDFHGSFSVSDSSLLAPSTVSETDVIVKGENIAYFKPKTANITLYQIHKHIGI